MAKTPSWKGLTARGRPPGRGGLPPGFVLVSVIFCNFNFNIDFYRLGVSFCASWGAPGSISEGFGLPKPSPNPPKIDPKSSLEKTLDFSSDFVHFFLVFRSSISWKCAFSYSKTTNPEVFAKNVFFRFSLIFAGRAIVLLAFHKIQCFAFGMHFGSEKPTKNPPGTTSEPFRNRCRKRVVFQH